MIYIPNKLIMIHIPRSGGTTFGRRVLGQLFKIPLNIEYKYIKHISNIIPFQKDVKIFGYNRRFERLNTIQVNDNKIWKHSTAKELLDYFGKEEWDRCYKIAISKRNIYSRLASFYFHKVNRNKVSNKNYPEVFGLSYEDYILNEIFDPKDNILNYITDHNGKIIVDKVFDFENINNDFRDFSMSFFKKKMNFSQQNQSYARVSYKSLYNDKMLEKINNIFKDEIEYFNWKL